MTKSLGQYVRINLSGHRFGTVTVLPEFEKMANGGTRWKYHCDCGKEDWAWAEVLKRQPDFCCKECRKKVIARSRTTHGMKYTYIYSTHTDIKTRVSNPNQGSYVNYGAKGIKMCQGLQVFEDFYKAISVLGARPEGYSIDRINNKMHYSCGKCPECIENKWGFNLRWANDEQQSNNRGTNKHITDDNGKTLTISQWARELGMDKTTIRKRLLKGWPVHKVLSLDDFRK